MKTIVVAGASAGVGRAVAEAFAGPDRHVALIARNRDRLEAAARAVRAAGGSASVHLLDLADWSAVDAAAREIDAAHGPIDVWVNAAMVTVLSTVEETTPDEYRRVSEVTYLGTVHGTKAALERMAARDRGVIVQIGSALAYRSVPLQSAYCGAKAAARGFTDSLRSELIRRKSGIRLTAVQLPAVNTPQFDWARNRFGHKAQPIPPIFQPERIAQAVVRAAERPRREYWLGWPATKAILGTRVLPGLGDRILASEAWEGQFTDEAETPGRPDNLMDSVARDVGARGRFDDRATMRSPFMWLEERIGLAPLFLAVVAVGAAAVVAGIVALAF